MSNGWVNLTVRHATRDRLMTHMWNAFLVENPAFRRLEDRVKTHDFMLNRLMDYYAGDDR